jgi:hypothetical protein
MVSFFHKGYRYIDTLGALEPYESGYTVDDLTENWGHYSPKGNEIISEYILTRLEKWHFTDLSQVQKSIQEDRKICGLGG